MLEIFRTMLLDKTLAAPLYLQLYEAIKNLIDEGTLVAHSRLPSIRSLAAILNVNQVTVVSAFKRLGHEEYVYSKPGSGTYISNTLSLKGMAGSGSSNIILDELYQQDDLPFLASGQVTLNENTINFASATPTSDLFPIDNFKVVLNDILDRDKGNAFSYQDIRGFLPLRECISQLMQKSNIKSNAENIQIISGAQQGIDIISKALLNQGDYVITESPTYTGAIAVFKSRGAEICDVEINKDGPDLNVLEYNLKKYNCKLIYTIPSFQNPTGHSYSNLKRRELLKLAERYNAYVIEDDYVSDLDFDNRGFVSLKSEDKGNRVIFIKSFSKIFMPGLRLGFMIVPSDIHGNILEAKHTSDISTSGLIQRAFDLYIRMGFWDKHFSFMYDIYKERYFKTLEALDNCLSDGVTYFKPGGGLNIWLDMPYGFPVGSLFKLSSSNDIVFAPGKIFYSNNLPQRLNNIRLSFASAYTEQIRPGIEKLCSIISSLQQKQDSHRNMPIL